MAMESTIQSKQMASGTPGQDRRAAQPVTEFAVTGMTCGNCARHVTEAAQGVTGVRSATVNLDSGQALVYWQNDATPNPEAVIQAVAAQGFAAKVAAAQLREPGEHKLAGWHLNLWIGVWPTLTWAWYPIRHRMPTLFARS